MNGDTLWCSDRYYSVWPICVVNAAVIILFPWQTKFTLCHCKVDLTHILAQWGVSVDSFPPKALIGSHSSFSRLWGWKANHVFVCLICISIALLSFEWFVFKHEVGLCKHTQTCLCTHTHWYISKRKDLYPCAGLAFKNVGIITPWFLRSSGFTTLQKY